MDLNKNNNINFSGIKAKFNPNGYRILDVTQPPCKEDESAEFILVPLKNTDNVGTYIHPDAKDKHFIYDFKDGKLAQPLSLTAIRNFTQAFAYGYKIKSPDGSVRDYSDGFATINTTDGSKMGFFELGRDDFGVTPRMGSMYHAFIDSNKVVDANGKPIPVENEFTRNHVNVLGGSLDDIIYLAQQGKYDNYDYLMLNPIFGYDKISSHGYWPENHYRCEDEEKLIKFVNTLLGRGTNYVADGAFTSLSINSPMTQHVFKWGEDSPFYNMLQIEGKPAAGILPNPYNRNIAENYKHFALRLVNPKGKNYDKTKPTYIQFFDDRLLSPDKQKDSKNLYYHYDIYSPKDHYDIVTDEDSIKPYCFEVDPNDKRLRRFSEDNTLHLSEIENVEKFLCFENFDIARKEDISAITCWDGSVDIYKIDYSNPNSRKFFTGVGDYWTEYIQREMLKSVAQMSDKEKEMTARVNQVPKENFETFMKDANSHKSLILEQNKTVNDYLVNFPMPSLQVSPQLSAVLCMPGFNREFLTDENYAKLSDIVNDTIDAAIPEQYKDNDEYRTYVIKTYAQDIVKNVLSGAINPASIKDNGKIDRAELEKVHLKTISRNALSPDGEKADVIRALSAGISEESALKIRNAMEKELKTISLDDFKKAEAIILQGRCGLNWRYDAAKDMANLDAVRSNRTNFKKVWTGDEEHPGNLELWTDFNKGGRASNPGSYVINEVTNLSEFVGWQNEEDMFNFDEGLYEEWKTISDDEKNQYENMPYYTAEHKVFLPYSASTTSSSFDKHFNRISNFAGVDPENGRNVAYLAGNVGEQRKNMKDMMANAMPHSALLNHFFTSNHDKPYVVGPMLVDMNLFKMNDLKDASPIYQKLATELTEGRTDYENIAPKAIATGAVFRDAIENKYQNNPELKDRMLHALANLASGRRDDEAPFSYKRANAFGAGDYRVLLRDIIQDAQAADEVNYDELLKDILEEGMERQERELQVANCLIGTPTLYNGAEYAQTGWEEPCKNPYVSNRNRIGHEFARKPQFSDYTKRVEAATGLHLDKDLSAIREGFPILMKDFELEVDNTIEHSYSDKMEPQDFEFFKAKIATALKAGALDGGMQMDTRLLFSELDRRYQNKDNFIGYASEVFEMDTAKASALWESYPAIKDYFTTLDKSKLNVFPIFRYDDHGSKTISLITNNGSKMGKKIEFASENGKDSCDIIVNNPKRTYKVSAIPLVDDDNICPLDDGVVLKRRYFDDKKKKYVDDSEKYTVKEGKIVNAKPDGKVIIDDATTTFYVPNTNPMVYARDLYNNAH